MPAFSPPLFAELYSKQTEHLRLIYYDKKHAFIGMRRFLIESTLFLFLHIACCADRNKILFTKANFVCALRNHLFTLYRSPAVTEKIQRKPFQR